MPRIEHIGLWVRDLENMRLFYETHFGAVSGTKYENSKKQFQSYFLNFDTDATRLELMHQPNLTTAPEAVIGWAHLAFALGSSEAVDAKRAALAQAGYTTTAPRHTGDGYYEATVWDPEGNLIELTI